MWTCLKCKRKWDIPDPVGHPLCACGYRGDKKVYTPKKLPNTQNPWPLTHTRYAAAIESGQWDESAERKWLDTEFSKLVPCGSCGSKWISLSTTIDLSTAERAFYTLWQAHNTVSTEHVNPPKPSMTYAHCRALYLPQPRLDIVAVTSLSPKRLERQATCLDTWKRFGLDIHCVQTAAEIESMRPLYPQVAQWHVSEESPPRITHLASVACVLGRRVVLINSDIEIRGEQRLFIEALEDGVLLGVRHNYDSVWWNGKAEEYGIDAFSFTPEAASQLVDLGFRIGKPVWDYWMLDCLKSEKLNWICEPLFFHKKHALAWTKEEFAAGFRLLEGTGSSIDLPHGAVFRKSFPYPPATK